MWGFCICWGVISDGLYFLVRVVFFVGKRGIGGFFYTVGGVFFVVCGFCVRLDMDKYGEDRFFLWGKEV